MVQNGETFWIETFRRYSMHRGGRWWELLELLCVEFPDFLECRDGQLSGLCPTIKRSPSPISEDFAYQRICYIEGELHILMIIDE